MRKIDSTRAPSTEQPAIMAAGGRRFLYVPTKFEK